MASIIRIKRSSVSGNPATLAAGELAYSALADNGSNGGDRLYVGMGTESGGNAANHIVIGGKYFTDMLDQTPGVLTASSAIVVDANKKIDDLLVDNLELNGNTLSTTNTNGDLLITPNGTGKTVVTNLYIGDTSTSLAEYIQDQTGGAIVAGFGIDSSYDDVAGTTTISAELASSSNAGVASFDSTDFSVTGTGENLVTLNVERIQDIVGAMVTSNTESGISVTYDDASGVLNFDVNDPTITIAGDVDGSATMTNLGNTTITVTLDTVNTAVGTYGSATQIPVITVNGKGLVTNVSTASISTSLSIAGNTGTDTVSLGADTLTVTGSGAISTAVTDNTVTISAANATTSTKGVASFSSSDFDVTSGAVALKSSVVKSVLVDGGTTITPSTNTISIVGGEGIDVTGTGSTITVAAELATSSNAGVATFNTASFTVTAGDVTIKSGGVSNAQLANSSLTIGSTTVSLGGTSTSLAGLTEITIDNININGNEISSTNTNGDIVINPNGTGNVDVSGAKITNLGTPTANTDAVTKAYVDTAVSGLDWKQAVNLMATSNVALTGSTSTLVIDGHSALDSTDNNVYRLLLTGQTNQANNGIYLYTDNGTTYTLVRAADADAYGELIGISVYVMEGVTYGGTGWVQTNHYLTNFGEAGNYQSWVQFAGAGAYVAGNGLALSGTTFSVNVAANGGIEIVDDALQLKSSVAGGGLTLTSGILAVGGTADRITINTDSIDIASTYAGQTSITTLGTVTTGTWNATTIATTKGGTGLTSYTTGDMLYASGTNTLAKLAAAVDGKVLQMSSGVPTWGDIDGGTY